MTRLSVNLNKVALIRNARGGGIPDLVQFARDCEMYGAQGITVHPRPDERHVRYDDLAQLKSVVSSEFNIEGYPSDRFMREVSEVLPDQVTLVPDDPAALTSDHGWDMVRHRDMLIDVVKHFKDLGIRVSLFADPTEEAMHGALATGTDRIELYTGPYAHDYAQSPDNAVKHYVVAAKLAANLGMGVNAGHDLTTDNLKYFADQVKPLDEVSIGHQLISDALYYGISSTIKMYLHQLREYDI